MKSIKEIISDIGFYKWKFSENYNLSKLRYIHSTKNKADTIRNKDVINFLFVLWELPIWKTESLYCAMLAHNRFNPTIGIIPSKENPGAEKQLIQYCESKGYRYVLLDPDKSLIEQVSPDIITYEKHFRSMWPKKHCPMNNQEALFVEIPYGMQGLMERWAYNQESQLMSWKYFFENANLANDIKKLMFNRGRNVCVTGTPFMDDLRLTMSMSSDPWKDNTGKKRIIYAPHHTIGDMHQKGINYSTFLEYAFFMLEMAEKYKDKAYFVFKPHPNLYKKLIKIWGKEKTDAYYKKWSDGENTDFMNGQYLGLFNYSDAMIHDCFSFTLEYHYTGNPVMFLDNGSNQQNNLSSFTKKALDLHYHAQGEEDIEQFINNVINGTDPIKDQREAFYKDELLPPHGKSASENIINAILGIEEYFNT